MKIKLSVVLALLALLTVLVPVHAAPAPANPCVEQNAAPALQPGVQAPVPDFLQQRAPASQKPPGGSESCNGFCFIVHCLDHYTCGPYIDANGQPACGCHP